MADYQLGYSGEEVDEVCGKVLGTSPLIVKWETQQITKEITLNKTTKGEITFTNILPEDAADRDNIFISVNCDFGGGLFDKRGLGYKRAGRNAVVYFSVNTPDGYWDNLNRPGTYTFTFYCLVIYRNDDTSRNCSVLCR